MMRKISMSGISEMAYLLARKGLRACYDEKGIVAGRHHYEDYWTRDAAFGCLGAIELGDFDVVRKQLDLLAGFQRKGMLPFLVRRNVPGLSMLGAKLRIGLFPQYKSHKVLFKTDVIDSNPYFVIVAAGLIKRGNRDLIERYKSSIVSSLGWCLRQMHGSLAGEGPIAGWNDGIYKSGRVLITNVLFYKAFSEWEDLCRRLRLELSPEFRGVSRDIKRRLDSEFFNGVHYIDWIDRERHDFFDSIGNLLAVYWGLADRKRSAAILDFVKENLVDKPLIRLSYPLYPDKYVELFNKIFGMGDYTCGLFWPEPGLIYAMCLDRLGRKQEGRMFLEDFAELAVKHRGIYEVYDKNKEPLRRLQYRAEQPYARGSALYILAYKSIIGRGAD